MSIFSDRLVKLKEEKNLLQKEVAVAIGTPLRTYQRYEHGEREPNLETLSKLANYFNVPTDYFLGTGLFSKFDIIIQYRAVIEHALLNLTDESITYVKKDSAPMQAIPVTFKDIIANLNNVQFVKALSLLVKDIEFIDNGDSGMTVNLYYYL